MPLGKSTSLEKVLDRVDDLDAANLAILVQRLVRERKLLETVFDTIQEGILVINEDGVIEYANEAASSLIGFKLKDLGRTVLWKLVPDLTRTLNFSSDGRYVEISIVARELHLTYPENRFVRLYLMPFEEGRSVSSDSPLFAVILSDITEEKLSTQEVIENERIASIIMLAAGVAHELGNPINSLNIHLQLMKRQIGRLKSAAKSADQLKNSLRICADELSRLDGIISNFLDAIRPTKPEFRDFDLVAALEEVLELMGRELENAGLQIDVEEEQALPVVLADPNQIKQVFFNVLKNASEAMEGGGTIRVRFQSDDEFVYIQIGDTGRGIERESFGRVFEPYYSTKEGGHGLGMMIVQRIVREHGGQIGIDSQPGRGTVVTLQFPQKHRRVRLLQE